MNILGIQLIQHELWLLGIVGTLLLVLIGHRLAIHRSRQASFNAAASIFRNEVFVSLQGIYPAVTVYRGAEEINAILIQSIPKITTAAAIFSPYLPFYRKRSFSNAVEKYSDTARKTDWNEIRAQQMFPVTYSGPSKMEIEYRHCVNNLLFYAKEN